MKKNDYLVLCCHFWVTNKCWKAVTFLIALLFIGIAPMKSMALSPSDYLHFKNVQMTVEQFFDEVSSQLKCGVFYSESGVDLQRMVNMPAPSMTLDAAMKHVLANKYSYKITNNAITIAAMQKYTSRQVKGCVKSESGECLPGVTILIKGTTTGVTTDGDGNYSIMVPASNSTMHLLFSFMGMKTQEVAIIKDVINVVMHIDSKQLQEVVVNTGYQTINARNLTSSVSSVKAEDILVAGMTSIDAALEGRIPDLMLMSNSGEVGATPRIRIRGTSTMLGNREPLWVLDGVILTDPVHVDPTDLNNPDYINIIGNAIAGINPQDIERIDVLKDASATALYGTRAANGVIVVTTKKGRSGKPRLQYNHTSKISRRPRYTDKDIHLMNSQERVRFGKELTDLHYIFPEGMVKVGYEGAYYRLQTGEINHQQFQDEVSFYEKVNTDWFDILTEDAYSHGHNVSLSGGREDMTYYASLGYDRDNGVSRGTYTERYTALANLNTELFTGLRLHFQFNGNVQKKKHQMDEIHTMDYAYNTTRALPCYNEDGSLFYYDNRYYSVANNPSRQYHFNILNELDNSSSKYEGEGIGARIDMKYQIMDGWDVDFVGAYNRNHTLQEQWWGEKTQYVAMLRDAEYGEKPLKDSEGGYCEMPYGGVLLNTNTISSSYTFRIQSDFSKMVGKDERHLIMASLGFEVNSNSYKTYSDEKRGFMKDRGLKFSDAVGLDWADYGRYELWSKKNHMVIGDNVTNMLATYATLSYSYNDHFTLNVNGRFDASNKFGSSSNHKFLPVWSVSGMWNAKENLLKNVNVISNLQLRASFGIQGNILEDQHPNLVIRKGTVDAYFGENTSNVHRFPNPDLRWEKTRSMNLTLDVDLFDSRLSFSGSYFVKKTKDCFTDVEISPINGFSNYVMNNGDLTNKGYNVGINANPIRTDNFSWQISAFWSGNKNKVEAETAEKYQYSDYLDGRALVPGQPIGTFYSYKYKGLNPTNGVPVFDDWEERRNLLIDKPLDEIVQLVLTNSGTREPKFFGNISTSLTYKNFGISASFVCSLGNKVRLFSLYSPILEGVAADKNVRNEFTNRWKKPGDELHTDVPVILSPADPAYENYRQHYCTEPSIEIEDFASNVWDMYDRSDLRVVSGNYLKCNSLSMRYTFNSKLLRKTPFSSAYMTLNATNLFTIAAKELKGQDPTQAGFDKPNLSVRPTYSLGINVTF